MGLNDYQSAVAAKVSGTWNLHHASLEYASSSDQSLDFFTLLSSVSGVVGNKGQASCRGQRLLGRIRRAPSFPQPPCALLSTSERWRTSANLRTGGPCARGGQLEPRIRGPASGSLPPRRPVDPAERRVTAYRLRRVHPAAAAAAGATTQHPGAARHRHRAPPDGRRG